MDNRQIAIRVPKQNGVTFGLALGPRVHALFERPSWSRQRAMQRPPRGLRSCASLLHSRRAAAVIAPDRRTWDQSIGAAQATIAIERFKPRAAALALMENWQASVGIVT